MFSRNHLRSVLSGALLAAQPAAAQETVTPAPNAEALFHHPNPSLNRNLQTAYHIMKDLLEAGHWDQAPAYLTPRYIQHNPNVASGRDTVVHFFASIGMKPKPIPARLSAPVVSVLAQGDKVVVVTVATMPDPRAPGKTYTTSWFDMWRFVDGKADEHWDSATLMPAPRQ
ncbi:nuclear transport factor 2 family protein [Novosphingobium sediminicola]|uniref:Putative SnoaL-like aldol condensation-catalyzing enzyme n=1 Tax=Novosphingobium sediminicola TaxID=563162 RepID=A0A7W6CH54_9SPHN|nr:nuclear transport factor 2 family protein [Novosphingobium sediminicola]MBB3954263.1 putative SnoaL-like aldol condensation-catalyzing enzyme [Novosphingobium sediminicola]